MKTLLMATFLLFPLAAQAMCYTVYDASDKMIYRSATSPVSLKGSLRDAVQERFPGGAMTITNDYSCPSYDRAAAEAQERANAAEAKRRNAERGEATRVTAEQERMASTQQAKAASGSRNPADPNQKSDREARLERRLSELKNTSSDPNDKYAGEKKHSQNLQMMAVESELGRAEACRKAGYKGPACAPTPAEPAPQRPMNCMPNGIGGMNCF
jgi:hypothetical protein